MSTVISGEERRERSEAAEALLGSIGVVGAVVENIFHSCVALRRIESVAFLLLGTVLSTR